jgi:hypothetical protein
MKTALITTTINVPTVLELYRQHGPDVAFFVAGDVKTPDYDRHKWPPLDGYLSPERQKSLGYKCSELIGWNSIQRRNIALLEAVKWGADIIVSIDDDNIPLPAVPNTDYRSYFNQFRDALGTNYHEGRFNGIKVTGLDGWFDVGRLLDPVAPHRGFPISHGNDLWRADHATNARVGVAAGICLGDPDVSAVTRLAHHPEVHRVSELLNTGIIVDNKTWTVFNSQNTAFIRELAPAFFMLPGVGRMDDIYASLIMQRLLAHRGLHVHFGRPYCWQSRNPHNLVKDLRAEIDGIEGVEKLADALEDVGFMAHHSNLECIRSLWNQLERAKLFPAQTVETALAFLDDCEAVL